MPELNSLCCWLARGSCTPACRGRGIASLRAQAGAAGDLRQAQVRHLCAPVLIEQDIAGFDVSMNDGLVAEPLRMQCCQPVGHIDRQLDGVLHRDEAVILRGILQPALEALTSGVLHHKNQLLTIALEVVALDNVAIVDRTPPAGPSFMKRFS